MKLLVIAFVLTGCYTGPIEDLQDEMWALRSKVNLLEARQEGLEEVCSAYWKSMGYHSSQLGIGVGAQVICSVSDGWVAVDDPNLSVNLRMLKAWNQGRQHQQ